MRAQTRRNSTKGPSNKMTEFKDTKAIVESGGETRKPEDKDITGMLQKILGGDFKPIENMPPPNCPICRDTGWKRIDRVTRDGRPFKDHERCECARAAMTAARMLSARIPEKYKDCNFDNFMPHGPHKNTLSAGHRTALDFAKHFPNGTARGLLFVGPVGTGKTHLSIAALKILIARGYRGLFYEYRELLKAVQESYDREAQCSELAVLRPIFETPVLIIDEIGAAKPTEWVWDTVSLIINTRYNERRVTIFTTNYRNAPGAHYGSTPPRHGEQTLGDRITEQMRSRINEMCAVIELTGADFRQTIKSIK